MNSLIYDTSWTAAIALDLPKNGFKQVKNQRQE